MERKLRLERDALIQREYSYVTGRYGIEDAVPPTSGKANEFADLNQVDIFKGFETASHEACSQ